MGELDWGVWVGVRCGAANFFRSFFDRTKIDRIENPGFWVVIVWVV